MATKKTTEKTYKNLLDVMENFPTEKQCVEHLENLRWPKGIICPCCGSNRKIYNLTRGDGYKCADCQKNFSVRKGTIFEESRLPLRKWFAAAWLITSHRKGISSHQLAREIGVTQKTAWFMLGRLREVAASMGALPFSGEVETDETFLGGKAKNMHAKRRRQVITGTGGVNKHAVVGTRERSGKVKAMRVADTGRETLHNFIKTNVVPGSTVYTDEHRAYLGLKDYFHQTVQHSVGEYVKGNAHTNGIESFWAMLKRGYYGTFHHFTWKHLPRYLAEFQTRWNMFEQDGAERLDSILESVVGSRLTYKELIA
jgi:transposase-like protein